MSKPETAFSPQTVGLLIAVGLLAFAGAAYFMVFGDSGRSSGANSQSKSAIGHMGFVELLRQQGKTVIVSRSDSATKASIDSLLIVAEPLEQEIENTGGLPLAARTLIVLPKWRGSPDPGHPGWIDEVALRQVENVEKILQTVLPDAALIRPSHEVTWTKSLSADPVIDRPQLITADGLIPVIASRDGVLVGGIRQADAWLFVIADPDLLSNHGIGRSDNAALFLEAIALFQPDGGPVIIDETMHGFHSNPDFWRQLFELPFLVPTTLALIALAVLTWTATSRFGAPLPKQQQSRTSELSLIENAVDLLHQANHSAEVAQRYPAVVFREVSQRLHVPRRLNEQERLGWIDRVGTARGIAMRYRTLRDDVETAASDRQGTNGRVLRAIQRLYEWKQEMLDGPGRDTSG